MEKTGGSIYMELSDALDTSCSDHEDKCGDKKDKTCETVFYR